MSEHTISGEMPVAARGGLLLVALLADAVGSGASAVVVLAAAGWLSPALGLPVGLLRGAGVVLISFVALLVFAATRPRPATATIELILVFNAAWALASFAIVAVGLVAPTTLGGVVVIGQALAVVGVAILQYVGLRRRAGG